MWWLLAWPVAAAVLAWIIGRAIKLADQREDGRMWDW